MTPVSESVAHQVLEAVNVSVDDTEQLWRNTDDDDGPEHDCLNQNRMQQSYPTHIDVQYSPCHPWTKDVSFPPFVKPLSRRLGAEEWQYLSARGCFAFPPLHFQKIIVDRFMEYIYPLLPVLYAEEITNIEARRPVKRISLALYHALLGAGLAAVDDEVISQYGYSSKSAARDEFYTKAKALMHVDTETGRLVTCQVALLLVGWSTNNDPVDGFYWSSVAINEALSMSLPRPTPTLFTRRLDSGFRQRLWWTIVMQEADVCLSTGRPPRLSTADCPDFQIWDDATKYQLEAAYMDLPGTEKIVRDSNARRLLQVACFEKAKLAVIILKLMTHLNGFKRCSKIPPESQNAKSWQFDALLRDWKHKLPGEMRCISQVSNSGHLPKAVQLTMSMVVINYLTALIILHKSEVPGKTWPTVTMESSTTPFIDDKVCWHHAHTQAMRRAADEITEIYTSLYQNGLASVIPGMGIPTLCAAVGVHLLDARSGRDPAVQTESFAKLDRCLIVLRDTGKLNETATEIVKLVESAVSGARLGVFSSGRNEGLSSIPRQVEDPINSDQPNNGISSTFVEENILEVTADANPSHSSVQQERSYDSPPWMDSFMQLENFFNFEIVDSLYCT